MVVCSVIGCGMRNSRNQASLTMHRFPTNASKKKMWLDAIGIENIKTNIKCMHICSLHFHEECFNKTLNVIRLRDDAVPSKFVRVPLKVVNTSTHTDPHAVSDSSGIATCTKPLMLQGHERAITQIKYNREGDLLFSAAKDSKPNVWWSLNGERLGTFNGHGGVVWCLDVDWQSINLITGGGDSSCRLWDLETGKNIATVKTNSSVRTCNFSFSSYQAAYTTDKAMGHPCEVSVIDTRTIDESISTQAPILKWEITDSKVTSMVWGILDETLITGHEAGDLIQWDLRTGKKIHSIKEHTHQINDMQLSRDGTMFITASKDQTAKLFDTASLELLKEYKTERPVNSAALSPILDHVVLGGGQDAMEVTTTSTRQGKFDARFFHLVFEEEFGRVKGHFGPINSLAFHPDGKSYASGGEDGYVRVQSFDQSYFDYTFDYNRE